MAQFIIGLVNLVASFKHPQDIDTAEQTAFLPISTRALEQHNQSTYFPGEYRYSRDSGHFTASEASRSQSISSMQDHKTEEHQKFFDYQNSHADTDAQNAEKQGFLKGTKARRVASRIAAIMSQRTSIFVNIAYNAVDCVSLLLGFAAIVSGAVVYGGVFVSFDQYSYPGYLES